MRKINESFTCIGCQQAIGPASRTCRNHCPHCFTSLHIDGDIPGDRATDCGGTMYPYEYEIRNGQTKIHFICTTCHKTHRNKAAYDDELAQLDQAIFDYKKYTLALGS